MDRAQVSGNTLGTCFSIIIGRTASICGVPPLLIERKMLSRLTSLFMACTALGTRYSMSSTMKWILRPLMPPFALMSSNAMRIELAALVPCTAVTPDRSVIMPMAISVSDTPRVAVAAGGARPSCPLVRPFADPLLRRRPFGLLAPGHILNADRLVGLEWALEI